MQEAKAQKYLKGAAILASASIFVKIIGAFYKIPLFQDGVLGEGGSGIFQVTYNVYTLILTVSTAGIPAALSRLVSAANAKGDTKLVRRYYLVAMPAFILLGVAAMAVMFFFSDEFALLMNNSLAAPGIRVLAPAVFFGCIISVYRGYAQGLENMIPTALSQVIEVLCKFAIGVAAALWLVSVNSELQLVSAGALVGATIGLGVSIPPLMWYKRKLDRGLGTQGDGSLVLGARNTREPSPCVPSRMRTLGRILKVSVPITLTASFMSIMVVIVSSIVLGRLQTALMFTEKEASALFGIYSRGLTIYNLPPSLVVPVSISIIPAIAAALARKRDDEAGVIMQSSLKLVNLIAMPASAGMMVLASPILIALYNDSQQLASTILVLLGAASFFVCLQYITTAILQANGHERVALMTFPVGAALNITLVYFLAGNPDIGIIASAIGTLACFVVISILNIAFILARVRKRPKFIGVFVRPFLCSAVMAAAAYFTYEMLYWLGSGVIGTGRSAVIVYLAVSILVAVALYGVLIIVTRTVTIEDMRLVPRGEKLARILRIR